MSFGIAAAAVGAAGAIGSAVIGSRAAKKAGQAQSDAANRQLDMQWDMYQQQREDQEPWRQAGTAGLNKLSMLLGLDPQATGSVPEVENADEIRARLAPTYRALKLAPQEYTSRLNAAVKAEMAKQQAKVDEYKKNPATSNPLFGSLLDKFSEDDFKTDPGYEFRLGEGQKSLESSAAARGGLLSGAAAKALTKYNQNFASNEYQNAYNRFNNDQGNIYNRLAGIAGVGQTATNATQQAGNAYMNGASNAMRAAGNASAGGYLNQANAWNYGLGGAAGALSNLRSSSTYSPVQPGTFGGSSSGIDWSGNGNYGSGYSWM